MITGEPFYTIALTILGCGTSLVIAVFLGFMWLNNRLGIDKD